MLKKKSACPSPAPLAFPFRKNVILLIEKKKNQNYVELFDFITGNVLVIFSFF